MDFFGVGHSKISGSSATNDRTDYVFVGTGVLDCPLSSGANPRPTIKPFLIVKFFVLLFFKKSSENPASD